MVEQVILDTVGQVVTTFVITLIGVFGAWLTAKIGQNKKLQTINVAQQELISSAQLTVEELMQTVVSDLKAGRADGKLTNAEIDALGRSLLAKTKQKMSKPSMDLLISAAVDVDAIIRGAGESWIMAIKRSENKA